MYESAVQNLIDELGRLPGVGPKSAQRIAFYILNAESAEMEKLTRAISTVKKTVSFCEICGNVSETKLCAICRDPRRDPSAICVVEESKDVVAIERTRSFTGKYHVLGGAINPLAGLGPDQLRIRELVARLVDDRIQEVILAMDPNLEGEATATYLSRMLSPIGIRVSRLASGLPVGGDLEYADEITLGRALEGRRIISAGTRFEAENAVEDFEEEVQAESKSAQELKEQKEQQKAQQPKQRWAGSMFDDLGSSTDETEQENERVAPQDSAPDSAQHPAPGSAQAMQASLNEPLLEAHLKNAKTTRTARNVPGETEPEPTPHAPESAGTEDSPESVPAVADQDGATQLTREEQEASQQRRADYEDRLAELKKSPLRTAPPEVPPIPGATYVDPWS